jgi:hypothetical protein
MNGGSLWGDLWVNNFDQGSVTRLDAAMGAVQLVDAVASSPSFPIVAGKSVWLGDWDIPEVVRLRAMGSPSPQHIRLPAHNQAAGVWSVAEGGGYVWATTPRDHALWRIDVKTDAVTRVPMPYLPTCVTATADEVWVTVR